MFYVKTDINEATSLSIEINDENVFTICPGCGLEHQVDLQEVLSGDGDLFGTAIYCAECSQKISLN